MIETEILLVIKTETTAETSDFELVRPKIKALLPNCRVEVHKGYNPSDRGFAITLGAYADVANAIDNIRASGLLDEKLGREWEIKCTLVR